jgi:hypothetical protein
MSRSPLPCQGPTIGSRHPALVPSGGASWHLSSSWRSLSACGSGSAEKTGATASSNVNFQAPKQLNGAGWTCAFFRSCSHVMDPSIRDKAKFRLAANERVTTFDFWC